MTETKPFLLSSGRFFLSEMVEQATLGSKHPAAKDVRRAVGMYPSSASAVVIDPKSGLTRTVGACLRASWYKLRNTFQSDPSEDPKMERIRNGGEILAEKFVYEPAKQAGIYVADEVSFYDPENVLTGRYDIMIRLPNGELMGNDVKTISVYKEIPHITSGRNGYDRLEPRWKDVCQIMCYMQWYLQHGVKYWSLLYMSREFSINEFVFEWANVPPGTLRPGDEAYLRCYSSERVWDLEWLTWGAVRSRFSSLHEALMTKQIPPRDYQLCFDNETLVAMATAGGSGNQLIPLNKSDGETILKRYERARKKFPDKNINEMDPFMEKGDNECGYCEFKTLCWFGLQTSPNAVKRDSPVEVPTTPKTDPVKVPDIDLT